MNLEDGQFEELESGTDTESEPGLTGEPGVEDGFHIFDPEKGEPEIDLDSIGIDEFDFISPKSPKRKSHKKKTKANDADSYRGNYFAMYLRDVGRHALLTREQEYELGTKIGYYRELIEKKEEQIKATNSKKSRRKLTRKNEVLFNEMTPFLNHLVRHNLRLVVKIAAGYQGRGLDIMDLIQEGNLGLRHAAYKFDASKGFRLSTYSSWWIRQSMIRSIADKGRSVRVPVHTIDSINRMNRFIKQYQDENSRDPTTLEIGEFFELPEAKVASMLMWLNARYIDLDAPVSEDGNTKLIDLLKVEDQENSVDEIIEREKSQIVKTMLDNLSDRHSNVVKMRFGIDAQFREADGLTLEQIGTKYEVTRERIRQIEKEALTKLRRAAGKMITKEEY